MLYDNDDNDDDSDDEDGDDNVDNDNDDVVLQNFPLLLQEAPQVSSQQTHVPI